MTTLLDFGFEKEVTREELERLLKQAADIIRTRVDYKYILILLFLKRISDKWKLEFELAKKEGMEDGLSKEEAEKEAMSAAYHDFALTQEFLWDRVREDINKLPEMLANAFKKPAEMNPDLQGVVDRFDFIEFTTNRENIEILRQLVELFSKTPLANVSPDVLGDAYEWVLRYFAPQKAKEGWYTHQEK